LDGLQAMARWALDHPGIVAMSLRNEMRQIPVLNTVDDWYKYIAQAGSLVHATNPNVLVVVGGTLGGMDLSHVRTRMLDTTGWVGKHVWEFHAYSYSALFPRLFDWCWTVTGEYGWYDGFLLEQGKDWTAPLFLGEFGLGMADGSADGFTDSDSTYLGCLVDYMTNNDAEWSAWALQGSYYVRDGIVDYDEGFGLLTKDWSGWRNANFKTRLGAMWDMKQGP
jgi:endoglucanase